MAATQKTFSKLPWSYLSNSPLETQDANPICLPGTFLVSSQDKPKNREGKRGMRSRAGMECSSCTPSYPLLWFVQASFKLFGIHHCHEESPSVLAGNEREGREKKDGVGESWLFLAPAWRSLHHSTALECPHFPPPPLAFIAIEGRWKHEVILVWWLLSNTLVIPCPALV